MFGSWMQDGAAAKFLDAARQIGEDAKNMQLDMAGFTAAPTKDGLERVRDMAFRLSVSAGYHDF